MNSSPPPVPGTHRADSASLSECASVQPNHAAEHHTGSPHRGSKDLRDRRLHVLTQQLTLLKWRCLHLGCTGTSREECFQMTILGFPSKGAIHIDPWSVQHTYTYHVSLIAVVLNDWFFFFCHAPWLAGSYLPDQGLKLDPQQWKCWVQSAGTPRTCHWWSFKQFVSKSKKKKKKVV